MIFIVVKFEIKFEWIECWLDLVVLFIVVMCVEEGNLWFEWFCSFDDLVEYVLVEFFCDGEVGGVYVNSDYFR